MTPRNVKFCRNCYTKTITLRQIKCRNCGSRGRGGSNLFDVRAETLEEAQAREVRTARVNDLIKELLAEEPRT
jgi:hypothetical protein